jgi:hypothetical protein
LLHEIDHAVNDSSDPSKVGSIGVFEDHLNQMRRELNLPERSDYSSFRTQSLSGFSTKFVRLAYDQKDEPLHKHHRYWLMWDAAVVGGLVRPKQIAQLSEPHN